MCKFDDRIKAVYELVSKELNADNSINTIYKRHLMENIDEYSLCVGAGISADVHKIINEKKYLWNELVYGIAEVVYNEWLLEEIDQDDTIFDSDEEEKQKICDLIISSLQKLSVEGDFLGTDDTMECVEYLKSIVFEGRNISNDLDAIDTLNENAIALIIYDLFYRKLCLEEGSLINAIECLKNNSKPKAKPTDGIGEGKTIIELAKLIEKMSETHNVKVLTYNYDDFLEMTLGYSLENSLDVFVTYDTSTQRNPKSYRTDLKESSFYIASSVPDDMESNTDEATREKSSVTIYHVHGYVPHYWNRMQMYGELVFSENSYSHMADEVYNWTNRIQSEVFSCDRVLFVGLSGTDTNFRRLMREIHKEWHRTNGISSHYYYNCHTMFMGYNDLIKKVCTEAFSDGDVDEATIEDIAKKIVLKTMSAKNEYYKNKLGIELIWYYDHKEIADVLHEIKLYIENRDCNS